MSLREELQQVYDQYGQLTARLVLDQARENPDGALHHHVFHVTSEDAADRYYLARCRQLIRSVRIRYTPDATKPEHTERIRAYHSTTDEQGRAYRGVEDIVQDDFQLKLLQQQLEREWRALWAKAQKLNGFAELIRRDIDGGEAAA